MHTLHKKTFFITSTFLFCISIFAGPAGSMAQSAGDHALAGAYYDLTYATEAPNWIHDTQDLRIVYPERAPLEGYQAVGTTAFLKKEIQSAKSAKLKYFIFPLTLNNSGIVEQEAFARMKTLLASEQFFFVPQFDTKNILLFPEQWKTAVTSLSADTTLFKSTSANAAVYISYDFNTITSDEKTRLSALLKDPAFSHVSFYAVSDLYKEYATKASITGLSGTALSDAVNSYISQSMLFPCDKDVYTKAYADIENAVLGNNLNALTHCKATPGGGSGTEGRLFSPDYITQYLNMKPVISERANILTSIDFAGVIGDKYLPWTTQTSPWNYYETYQEAALRIWNSILKQKPVIPVYPSFLVAHDKFYADTTIEPTILAGSPKLYNALLEASEAIFGRTYPEGYFMTAGDWNNYETGNIILPSKAYGTSYVDLLTAHLQ